MIPSDTPAAQPTPSSRPATGTTTWAQQTTGWYLTSLLIGCMSVLYVILSARIMPILDWPQHLLTVAVMAWPDDPVMGFGLWFQVEWALTTYLGAFVPGVVFAWLTSDPELALRIVTGLGLAFTPPAFGSLLAALGRSPWWSHLLWPFVFGFAFAMGFVSFCVSLPWMFLTLTFAWRTGEATRRMDPLWLAAAAAMLFLTHSFAWMVAMALTALLGLAAARTNWRALLKGITALLPSVAMWAWWLTGNYQADVEDRLGASSAVFYAPDSLGTGPLGGSAEPLTERLRQAPALLHDFFRDDRELAVLALWLIVATVLIIVGAVLTVQHRSDSVDHAPPAWAAPLAGLALTAVALLIPNDVSYVYAVGPRFGIVGVAGLILLFAGRTPSSPTVTALLFAPALATGVWNCAIFLNGFNEVAEESVGLDEIMQTPGERGATWGLMVNPASSVVTRPIHLHAAGRFVTERGGALGFTFFNNTSTPVRLRTPGALPWPGRRGEWEPRRFRDDVYGRFYDRIFARGVQGDLHAIIRAPRGTWQLEARHGDWSLWRRTRTETRAVRMSVIDRIHRATVTIEPSQGDVCSTWDGRRHQCSSAEWVWVGPAQQPVGGQDLPCVWAHPVAGRELVVRFDDVPADATRIEGFSALFDSAFQGGGRSEAAVTLRVLWNGQQLGEHINPAQADAHPFGFDLPAASNSRANDLEFRIFAENDARRHFCFDAWILGPDGTRAGVSTPVNETD